MSIISRKVPIFVPKFGVMKQMILILALFLAFPSPGDAKKRAFLVGISKYRANGRTAWGNIHGKEDVDSLAPALIKKGFSVTTLVNEQATYQGITNSLKSESVSNYEAWYRAKIISYDDNSKLLFVEINENIEIIDNLDLIRPLKEVKYTKNELLAYNIKSIQKSDYEKIKGEIDKINNSTELDESNSTSNKIIEIHYSEKHSSLSCIGSKDLFRKISILKQYEQRNKKNISEEPNTNSDFSNPNSNKNLVGIKSPSGRSETSDYNNSNKNIILERLKM